MRNERSAAAEAIREEGVIHAKNVRALSDDRAEHHQKYRDELWKPFVYAVKKYELIQAGDKIAVCISGGKDSMLMAKLM